MSWFNYYGLVIMFIIMVPNIIYYLKQKNIAQNSYKCKLAEVLEQIGRYACFVLMIFNIPYTYFNFWFNYALIIYLVTNSVLCLIYLLFWAICWNKTGLLKAISLSVSPTVIFLFSGIILASIPLIVSAVLFGVNHILISYKNVNKPV